MKQTENGKPGREQWAALCGAIMRAEYVLERLGQRRRATEEVRGRALAAEFDKLELEAAYGWLVRQRPYREALKAYSRHVGSADADRFELVSAIAYAMESSYAAEEDEPVGPSPQARKAGIRHARELARIAGRHGGALGSAEEDAQLMWLLKRYVERNEAQCRAARAGARNARRQWRYGQDVAMLLLAACGVAPASVIRPLMRLAGPAVPAERISALLAETRREIRMLEGGKAPREAAPVLQAIAVVPTRKPRRTARTPG